jgi:hypothetical protein
MRGSLAGVTGSIARQVAYYPTHGERNSQLDHGGSAQHCAAAVCVRVVEMSDARSQPLRRLRCHRLLRWSKGHSVSVLWRGGEVDTIFGFEKEEDALQWIKEKSQNVANGQQGATSYEALVFFRLGFGGWPILSK